MTDERQSETVEDLRSTSEAILNEVDHVRAIEEERSHVATDDPARLALDQEASSAAHRLRIEAEAETELAKELGPNT